MTAAEVRLHLRYSGWASHKVLDAVLALPAEAQDRPMGVSHESILGTLSHVYLADRIWYKRAVEPDLPMPPWDEKVPLEVLTGEWPALQKRWEAWADSLADGDTERILSFTFMNGSAGESPLAHVVLHVVNHATLHRGQVVGMLRQVGVKPPATDLIFYLRELKSARN